MTPMNLAGPDLLIVLVLALLLFGGSRLAGVGKSAGQAIREFKEETADLSHVGQAPASPAVPQPGLATTQVVTPAGSTTVIAPANSAAEPVDATVVEENRQA